MSKTPQISARDIRGVIAYLMTPVRRDVPLDRNVRNAVDLDEAARAADVLVRDGAGAIVLNGTIGEVASLTFDEIMDFTRAVVESVRDRVPVFAGATTLNTRDTIERARQFREIGAHGLNLGRPMMSPLSDAAIVKYHRDVAAEVPELAIFLYDDPNAFKRPIQTAVYAELAKIPQIVASKYRTQLVIGSMATNTFDADIRAVGSNIKLTTHDVDWAFAHKMFGLDAAWSSAVCSAPGASIALQEAIFGGDYEKAARINQDIEWFMEGLVSNTPDDWQVSKIPTLKTMIDTAGYIKCGPALPPYDIAPQARFDSARGCGLRAQEIQKKYPHKTAGD